MSYDFSTTTHGKWILAGEHAVVRGHPALVFPLSSKTFTLNYQKTSAPLTIEIQGLHEAELPKVIEKLITVALNALQSPQTILQGHLKLENKIPLGVGMGGSAALCVAISRWLEYLKLQPHNTVTPFAQTLEHQFHGKSSGLDIAGVSHTEGLFFQQGHATPLQQTWHPHWMLSYSGASGKTKHCIRKVQSLWQSHPHHALQLDTQMTQAVYHAKAALEQGAAQGLPLLTQAIEEALDCFIHWRLVTPELTQHMSTLKELGAVACKPTGSGGGGYVLSLWSAPSPTNAGIIL